MLSTVAIILRENKRDSFVMVYSSLKEAKSELFSSRIRNGLKLWKEDWGTGLMVENNGDAPTID